EYVCTDFNDSFVAWLTSTAFSGTGGDLNISYDAKNNPVSVNNGFFDRCTPNATTGCQGTNKGTAACAGGPNELEGTGFYNLGNYCSGQSTGGGATGWLTTKAPVKQGETMTIQFIIWDTGDQNWDSSVLVDNFQWQPGPTQTGTGRPAQ
ncbi:MAG: choice-of-anchor L domain-containing protein, partial [Polyangiaceae bacterium]